MFFVILTQMKKKGSNIFPKRIKKMGKRGYLSKESADISYEKPSCRKVTGVNGFTIRAMEGEK